MSVTNSIPKCMVCERQNYTMADGQNHKLKFKICSTECLHALWKAATEWEDKHQKKIPELVLTRSWSLYKDVNKPKEEFKRAPIPDFLTPDQM